MYLFNTKYNIKRGIRTDILVLCTFCVKNELMFQYVCCIGFYFITFVFKK